MNDYRREGTPGGSGRNSSRGGHVSETITPDLTGRQARCSCGRVAPSDPRVLAFFEYRGPGSPFASDICTCGFAYVAHTAEGMARNVPSNRRTVIEQGKCTGFVARGGDEYDSYYCGHGGWD